MLVYKTKNIFIVLLVKKIIDIFIYYWFPSNADKIKLTEYTSEPLEIQTFKTKYLYKKLQKREQLLKLSVVLFKLVYIFKCVNSLKTVSFSFTDKELAVSTSPYTIPHILHFTFS